MRPIQYNITAVDRATEVINRISNRVERLSQPFSRLSGAVRRFSDVSGVNKFSKSLGDLTSRATSLLGVILKIGAPLLALFGGGSLMGIYQMTERWAHLGFAASTTSQIIGISTQKLFEWRAVGDLVGISAETMTKGFQSFSDTLQDAKWGRNQAVFGMLKMLNIDLKHTKNGVIDTEAVLYQLADRIQKVQKKDPAAARKLADSFGVSELLPVLMNGSKAMRSYQNEVKSLQGNVSPKMIERASGFALAINKMKIAAEGTKASIADKLIPVFQPLIEKWTQWLTLNRTEISDKIAKLAERFAKWLDKIDFNKALDGIVKFIDGCIKLTEWIDKTVDKFGGWENIIKGVGIVLGVGFVANIGLVVAALAGMIGKLGIAATSVMGLGTALKWTGGIGIAGAAGWGVGTLIRDQYLKTESGRNFDDWSGKNIARFLAFFGNDTAREALESDEKYANGEKANKPTGKFSFDHFKKSIITQESGGNYGAVNKRTGALGFAQVMPQNIEGWGKNRGKKKHGWDYEALGFDITPREFLANPLWQEKIVDFKLQQAFDKYGASGAARWWYSNNPNPSDKKPTPNEPSPNEYAQSVLNRMRGQDSNGYLSNMVGNQQSNQQQPINVKVNTTVHPNGSTTTKVETPQSVKVVQNQPGQY
ncbi:transglycosylase SLT domain-containing protein [Acinetobacter higginsii]|uniref:transglycosylase SLT domain-containing protein n=1 Tax=Acinetobacter higginsii TaxID=70347 RepID=UPI001F4B9C54|nr:transglycosylase SLT domain-containing protein [Acinetobacter higginsii]MCH7381369.1 transglycosylase SLT domain-containing protein [Acinetobacter higginsii]